MDLGITVVVLRARALLSKCVEQDDVLLVGGRYLLQCALCTRIGRALYSVQLMSSLNR